ncbi:hypothetical protein [Yunchengibacter salinarum]|uniref:hypothetical protein n=1 Tax=Yunchengibacter salinarum TaxID=3133399 RepID=UPI0035B63E91
MVDAEDDLTAHYKSWMGDTVAELATLRDACASAGDTLDEETARRIYELSHNIKGLSGSFGYGLMTGVGTSLCRYFKHHKAPGSGNPVGTDPALVDSHLKAFQVIWENDITGDGGEKGEALIARLAGKVDAALADADRGDDEGDDTDVSMV